MKQEGRREYLAYLLVELQQPGMLRRRKPLCKFQQSPFLQLWNTSLKTPFVASSRVVQASDLQRYPRGSLQEHDRRTSLQFARTSGKNLGTLPHTLEGWMWRNTSSLCMELRNSFSLGFVDVWTLHTLKFRPLHSWTLQRSSPMEFGRNSLSQQHTTTLAAIQVL